MVPPIRLKTVVLPEPLGPISAGDRALRAPRTSAVDRAHAAEALLEALHLEQRRGRRRRCARAAPRARGGRCRSGARPRARPCRACASARSSGLAVGMIPRGMNSTTSTSRPPKIRSRALPPPNSLLLDLVEPLDDERAEHGSPQRRAPAEQQRQDDLDAEQDVEHPERVDERRCSSRRRRRPCRRTERSRRTRGSCTSACSRRRSPPCPRPRESRSAPCRTCCA